MSSAVGAGGTTETAVGTGMAQGHAVGVERGYGQYCPIAMAAEVLAERWTPLIIRNLSLNCHRFGEILEGCRGCPPRCWSSVCGRWSAMASSPVWWRRAGAVAATTSPHKARSWLRSYGSWAPGVQGGWKSRHASRTRSSLYGRGRGWWTSTRCRRTDVATLVDVQRGQLRLQDATTRGTVRARRQPGAGARPAQLGRHHATTGRSRRRAPVGCFGLVGA